jgi:hypothetical protein
VSNTAKVALYVMLGMLCLASAVILLVTEKYGPAAWGTQLALAFCWFLAGWLTQRAKSP